MSEFAIRQRNSVDTLVLGFDRYGFHARMSRDNDYTSPDGTISANFCHPGDVRLDERAPFRYSGDRPILMIDFRPYADEYRAESFGDALDYICVGGRDYIRFLLSLKSSGMFKDIDIVSGWTNPPMAYFATRYLGFEWVTPKKLVDRREVWHTNIYAHKRVLIDQMDRVNQLVTRVRLIQTKRNSR